MHGENGPRGPFSTAWVLVDTAVTNFRFGVPEGVSVLPR